VYNYHNFGQPAYVNINREEIFTMKSIVKTGAAVFLALALFASCSSNPKVTRIDSGAQVDLSGLWNDTDVRIVCDSLIRSCLSSPRVAQALERRGGIPPVRVGNFRTESDEHIDTSIISSSMEIAIFNSGKLDFVAGGSARDELRSERQDQQGYASESSAAGLGNEIGADFLLTGSVRTIIDRAGGEATRTYFVSAEMTSIETNARMWMDQNSEIKKYIQTPRSKL
jgi:PBP1b-binding outer membrane lipoprotein LpoB